MTAFKKKKSGVPDRWLDYDPVGQRIPATRFIAFKVPLKPSLTRGVSACDAFGPWELLDALQSREQQLGLIIDLTFTTRYYQLADVPAACSHLKIPVAGQRLPSDAAILSFKRAARRFLRDNTDNDKLLGVHCTHGLNRTGYLLCRYLIDVDGLEPRRAVRLFEEARGHRIERRNYLDDLHRGPRRSNRGMDEPEREPMRGLAVERPRPVPCPAPSDPPEERQPDGDDRRRVAPPQRDGLLPTPPLRPTPPLPPYRVAPPRYQWSPAPLDTQTGKPLPPAAPLLSPEPHHGEQRDKKKKKKKKKPQE